MSKKTKVALESGEAYVIATTHQWDHVINTYRVLAEEFEDPEVKQAWLDLAKQFEDWAYQTAYLEEIEDEWN